MLNREAATRLTVREEVVDRDLHISVPAVTERADLGPLFVPSLRLALLQLLLVREQLEVDTVCPSRCDHQAVFYE